MFKKVKDMTKEECLKEILIWEKVLMVLWFTCLASFIVIGFGSIKYNIFKEGPILVTLVIPLIIFFGLIPAVNIINDVMRKEGLIKEE